MIGDFVIRPDGVSVRVLAIRDCASCGEKDAIIVTSREPKARRAGKRFCSRACQRNGAIGTSKKRQTLKRAVDEFQHDPKAAEQIYLRAYGAGWKAGRNYGVAMERRRLVRIAIKAKRAREAA